MRERANGFTFIELLIAVAISLVVAAAVMTLYSRAVRVSDMVKQRTELESELRAAANQLVRDLDQAGTGIPLGGISLPSAASGSSNPKFGCDFIKCYLTAHNEFTQGVLYKVTPGNNVGPNTTEPTDAIIITYIDPTLNWTAYTTDVIADDGSTLTMPAGTTPPLNDPSVGLNAGDLLLVQNSNGSAIGVVTNYGPSSRVITFAAGDPLNLNQPSAPAGNIKSLRFNPVPTSPPEYPTATVSRIMMITYFIQAMNTPYGTDTRLMRQVGARTPTPVADHIEDLKFTYDVFDDVSSTLTAGLPDAATGTPPTPKPNQIRKINLTITVRAPVRNAQGVFDRLSLSTSIGPRNLSFRDRYN